MLNETLLTAEAGSAPLADVACCQDIPVVRSHVEPSVEPQLKPGQILDGRFVIRELISRGGMATVYRAEDRENGGREVSIKVPLRKVESDPAGYAQFRREEETGLRLRHPWLVRVYAAPDHRQRPYIVTEFLRGCTLAELGKDRLPLPEADAFKIVALLCEAVGHMHEQGVIHRDLKPSNVMICRDQTLRVMDFGLAAPPVRQRSALAGLAPIFGSPEYMAPEQVENGPIDERTDIYSLGAILYELLTGSVPFQNEDLWQSAYQRTAGDPIAPRKLNPALSREAEEIVLHALQRQPGDRYATMEAFQAELRAPAGVRVTGYAERLRPPRWKLSFHGTPVLAGLLLGFGAVLFLVVMFLILTVWPVTR